MIYINATNVNDAFHEAMWKMPVYGKEETTRNGKCLVASMPVVTSYQRPLQRMLWNSKRDANPFFHVMEAMWMLAGCNDLASILPYNKRMAEFSDNGVTLAGAYGHRWRCHWGADYGGDQLGWVVNHLITQPNSRRAVMTMWDPDVDTAACDSGGKDVPCNTTIYFRPIGDRLEMTVCCRSNDVVWGCYGANAVHMSFLHEFVAMATGKQVGTYYQFSNNWHIYERHFDLLNSARQEYDPYDDVLSGTHFPLLHQTTASVFSSDLLKLFKGNQREGFASPYLNHVIAPLMSAWSNHKGGVSTLARDQVKLIQDGAIALACNQWLQRRAK